jgi:subtilisin family serine protease
MQSSYDGISSHRMFKFNRSVHVQRPTGADQIRTPLGIIAVSWAELQSIGTGVTIASSTQVWTCTLPFTECRVKFKKDSPENKPDKDFYGHGSHVRGAGRGNYQTARARLSRRRAYNAYFVNLRVLDANGVGSTSNAARGIERS